MSSADQNRKTLRNLKLRFGISIAGFVAFLGFVANALFLDPGNLPLAAVLPLAIALIVLPRHRRSGALHVDTEPTKDDRAVMAAIGRLGNIATNLRMAYFLIVVVSFALVRYT